MTIDTECHRTVSVIGDPSRDARLDAGSKPDVRRVKILVPTLDQGRLRLFHIVEERPFVGPHAPHRVTSHLQRQVELPQEDPRVLERRRYSFGDVLVISTPSRASR